jgi:hypothetical protein
MFFVYVFSFIPSFFLLKPNTLLLYFKYNVICYYEISLDGKNMKLLIIYFKTGILITNLFIKKYNLFYWREKNVMLYSFFWRNVMYLHCIVESSHGLLVNKFTFDPIFKFVATTRVLVLASICVLCQGNVLRHTCATFVIYRVCFSSKNVHAYNTNLSV